VSRAFYTIDTVPFIMKWQSLALQALFAEQSPREIVYIKNAGADLNVGHYYFDIKTGLLLHKSQQQAAFAVHLTLAEINYDFQTKAAFAEDLGPHSAFSAWYIANKLDLVYGNQGYLFNPVILSRHRNRLLMTLVASLMNTGQPADSSSTWTSYVSYDGANGLVQERAYADDNAAWQTIGDHLFWWIPSEHLTLSRINLINLDLVNRGNTGDSILFESLDIPEGFGFVAAAYDADGYATRLGVVDPRIALYVDSADPFSKTFRVDGLSYYQNFMEPAAPALGGNPNIRGLRRRYQARYPQFDIPFTVGDAAQGLQAAAERASAQTAELTNASAGAGMFLAAISGNNALVPQKSLRIRSKGGKYVLRVRVKRGAAKNVLIALVARSAGGGASFQQLQVTIPKR
jgi:hypothetical protein